MDLRRAPDCRRPQRSRRCFRPLIRRSRCGPPSGSRAISVQIRPRPAARRAVAPSAAARTRRASISSACRTSSKGFLPRSTPGRSSNSRWSPLIRKAPSFADCLRPGSRKRRSSRRERRPQLPELLYQLPPCRSLASVTVVKCGPLSSDQDRSNAAARPPSTVSRHGERAPIVAGIRRMFPSGRAPRVATPADLGQAARRPRQGHRTDGPRRFLEGWETRPKLRQGARPRLSGQQSSALRPTAADSQARRICYFFLPAFFFAPPLRAAFLAPPALRADFLAPALRIAPPPLRPPPPLRLPFALLLAPAPLRPPPPPPDDLRARAPPDRRPVSEPPSAPSISAPPAAESPVSDSPVPPVSSSSGMSMPLSKSSCMCAFQSEIAGSTPAREVRSGA